MSRPVNCEKEGGVQCGRPGRPDTVVRQNVVQEVFHGVFRLGQLARRVDRRPGVVAGGRGADLAGVASGRVVSPAAGPVGVRGLGRITLDIMSTHAKPVGEVAK
jgi:hypothetical protein